MAKILIIDDDLRLLKLYSGILEIEGYKVLIASNGKDGFELAILETPDLILLDVMMPHLDGAEVAQSLSENEKTKTIPVVFLTSLVQEDEVDNSQGQIGGRKYISKSTPKEKFVSMIKEIL